jgi:predicted nucleotidyltransferase
MILKAWQIGEVVEQIKKQVKPQKVVLFGSYARGCPTEDSDVDLLIVTETELPPAKRYGAVRSALDAFPVSFDIIVKTPGEYEQQRSLINTIVYFAEKDGKVVYEQ